MAAIVVAAWVSPASAQRLLGIDVSQFQSTINWSQVKASGISFAFVRASHGSLLDTRFTQNMNGATAQGITVGCYHYAVPVYDAPYNLQGEDPQTQANRFLNYAQSYITVGYLRPVIDVELGGGQTPVGAVTLTAWVNAFNAVVKQATGVDCMIYANSNYCRNYLGSSLNVLPLWVADWCGDNVCTACGNMNTAVPEHGTGVWPTWAFWQYCSTGSVPGISGNVDLDVFNGTAAQLQNYVITSINSPPTISNVQSSNITSSTATIAWTTDKTSSTQVQFGLTTAYGNSSPLDNTQVTSHISSLTGLTANTLYHYRAVSTNAYGTTYSDDYTFTTNGPPLISNVQSINISASQATITWTTNVVSNSRVNYGITSGYGSQSPLDSANVTSHSMVLSGLSANTLYHYQVVSANAYGTTSSGDFTFTTAGPPLISNIAVPNIGSTTATITWTTNVTSNSQVEYGLTAGYGSASTLDPANVTAHSVTLTGLAATTLYHYRVRSANANGTSYSSGSTFTTIAFVTDIIVDNSDPGWANTSPGGASWTSGASGSVPKVGSTYLFTPGTGSAAEASITRRCTWTPNVQVAGLYDVYAFYQTGTNRNTAAPYKIFYNGGSLTSLQNQYAAVSGGDWFLIGQSLGFLAGSAGYVQLANNSADVNNVSADAIKLVYKGATAGPPSITQDPQQQLVCPGSTALFTVGASGAGTLSYRWQKNNVDLSDGGHYLGSATNSLAVLPVSAADVASYRCVVTNTSGSATSNAAALALRTATVITQQPVPLSVCSGSPVSFTVAGTGDGNVSYQWQRNNVNLAGGSATSNTYQIAAASALDAGTYHCIVTAGCGSVTSNDVLLVIGSQSPADLDHDCDVDAGDLSLFRSCLSGAGVAHSGTVTCQQADVNKDGAVDLADYAAIQKCFSGPVIPADPTCAN